MKENRGLTIVYIIILILIVIILITALILGITGNFNFGKTASLTYTESFDGSVVENLKIKSSSYDVDILPSKDNNFTVEVYEFKNKNNVQVVNNEGTLDIYQEKGNFCIGICHGDERIVLYVPETFENIEIKTSSGDIKILYHTTTKDISTTSGDIELLGASNNEVKSTSGEIEISKVKNSSVLTTSGDIDILDGTKELLVKSTSGDIELARMNGKVNVETTSGDIDITNLEITDNSEIESTSGDIDINHFGEGIIDAQTKSGDKDIKPSQGIYTLYVKTTSGDIEIR